MGIDEFSRRKFGAMVLILVVLAPLAYWAGRKFMVTAKLELLLNAPIEKKFSDALANDLTRLDRARSLPPAFHDIQKIKLFCTTKHLMKINRDYPLRVATSPTGKYTLEVFMDEIDGGGVVVQYDLVENKSGNTIWELGRTFPHNLEK